MILFRKWAEHKVKYDIYCVNQFLREKRHKKWNQECKQKQSLLFNFCNIFDPLTSRTQKIAWSPPVFKPDFYIFFYNEQLRKIYRNFIYKFSLYHTFLKWNKNIFHLFKRAFRCQQLSQTLECTFKEHPLKTSHKKTQV